jgi:hypothetical protein
MAVSGISAAPTPQAPTGQSSQGTHHRHGHHAKSLSDVDAQSSSVASAPSRTGKLGSIVNKTV